jgi:hypothetical protein
MPVTARNANTISTCLLVALAIGVSGCGDGDTSANGDERIAMVGDNPIERHQLDDQVAALRRGQAEGATPPARAQLEQQALVVLLQREWLEQEARRRGVAVDEAAARERWSTTVRSQFADEAALRRFLGRQTEDDAIAQLRLQMLSEAIERDVRGNARGNVKRALARHRRELERRSRAATSCEDGFQETPGCSR